MLRGAAGGRPATQTSPEWLTRDPERFLDDLSATHPKAAAIMDSILDGERYDAVIVSSRGPRTPAFSTRVDDAADAVRRSGQVARLRIVDVERPR
jgi:hypothetical protein